ncbi:packaged DNA stabilization protein [Ralstonia chuxiongensis]|uniref:Packaged DNA stabilization protein n=1 Tax=Ralstonia chuxiongensis TaxID=2957504 RepID=A0AA41WWT4_9RALS|nr:packaged DNA stabilization protein [Ralstonia chuxiongensis]MCP1173794.1 packaged DNA stabilization protein [Ralstonia chuxiongensis]
MNLYPERNPEDAAAAVTHYPTPGLTLVSSPPVAGESRCIYTATNGARYEVVAQTVYSVSSKNVYTALGTLTTSTGRVYMVDNGFNVFLVDGSTNGWAIDMASNFMIQISDPSFYGADRVDIVDGYFIFNKPNSQQFYISNYLSISFNSLDITSKSTYPDNLVTLAVMHREIWLFGDQTTEVWYNTGASDFTFGRMPGVFIEHGCVAKHSVAKHDLTLMWLSKDQQGQGIVLLGKNYTASRISTHAIEQEFQTYSRIDDAVGYTYQQGGHVFYVLSFPTANKTWCYDITTGLWHQRGYLEGSGTFSRHRGVCHSFNQGRNLVGDYATGNVYALDPNSYTDNGNPILCVRSFPHIGASGKRALFRQFVADMEVGQGVAGDLTDPAVFLRWSDDRGFSWGNPVQGSLGKAGDYISVIQFQRLGYARDRVFELSWSAGVKTALNGAYIDMSAART